MDWQELYLDIFKRSWWKVKGKWRTWWWDLKCSECHVRLDFILTTDDKTDVISCPNCYATGIIDISNAKEWIK